MRRALFNQATKKNTKKIKNKTAHREKKGLRTMRGHGGVAIMQVLIKHGFKLALFNGEHLAALLQRGEDERHVRLVHKLGKVEKNISAWG